MTINKPDTEHRERDSASDRSDNTQVGQVIQELGRLTKRLPGRLQSRQSARPRPRPRRGSPVSRERVSHLIDALGDPQHPDHAAAVNELVAIGPAAVPALNDVMNQNHPWLTAYRAAEAAGQIGDGRSVGSLIQMLQHSNSNVRWSAIRALTQIGDVRSLFDLRRIAQHDQGRTSWGEPVAGAAQSALDQLRTRSVLGQSIELVKTAVTSVLMILALTLAFSVVTALRSEFDSFGIAIPGQTVAAAVLPTVAPTEDAEAAAAALPTETPLAETTPTPEVDEQIIGTVLQVSNVRPQPNTNNPPVGRLVAGDEVEFVARSQDGQWYLVRVGPRSPGGSRINNPGDSNAGWVNRALVSPPDGDLPVRDASTTNAATVALT